MTYEDIASGIIELEIDKKRAIKELEKHDCINELNQFYKDLGNKEFYDAKTVLNWLGY